MGSATTIAEEKEVSFHGKILHLAAVNNIETALALLGRDDAAVLVDTFGQQTTVLIIGPKVVREVLELLGLGEDNRLSREVSAHLLPGPAAALSGSHCFNVPSKSANLFYQVSGLSSR